MRNVKVSQELSQDASMFLSIQGISKYKYYLLLSNGLFQRKVHLLRHEPFIWKDMMDDCIQRTVNILHSINEDEQVHAVLLDNIFIVEAR